MCRKVTLTTLVLSVLFAYAISADDVNIRSTRNAHRRRHRSRMLGWLSQLDRSSMEAVGSARDLARFIPEVPTPSEVDCHFDYVYVQELGGHCMRLGGGGGAACQSGMYLDVFNTECDGILRAREQQREDTSHTVQETQDDGDTSD